MTSPNLAVDLHRFASMAKCQTCGNNYDKSFQVIMAGQEYHFDSFECAAHALAPKCGHCSIRILGHGVESGGKIFCCVHCASAEGVEGLRDRA